MAGRAHGRARHGRAGRAERLDGLHVVREALRARRRDLHRLLVAPAGRDGQRGSEQGELIALADAAGLPVVRVEPGELRAVDGPGNPQRVALDAGPLPELDLRALLREAAGARPRRTLVLLDGVNDPQNLGAIARVAEAAGVCGLVLARRNAPPLSAAASRASAGALEWLPVARVGNLVRSISALKEEGFWVVAADAGARDTLFEVEPRVLTGDLVVVLGAEGQGLRRGVTAAVDHRVRIPLAGRVASLNVATAGAVILFDLVRRAREGPASAP